MTLKTVTCGAYTSSGGSICGAYILQYTNFHWWIHYCVYSICTYMYITVANIIHTNADITYVQYLYMYAPRYNNNYFAVQSVQMNCSTVDWEIFKYAV